MDGLKLIIDKLSQYNFLTNILPGTVLCVILNYFVGYDFVYGHNWYIQGVIFYFAGMVNNRFGSLVVEWLFKSVRFVKFAPYKEYIAAEKVDSKITTLSMENNVFRSYISVAILSMLSLLYKNIERDSIWMEEHRTIIILVLLFILFSLSYRKQTKYVKRRVEANLD